MPTGVYPRKPVSKETKKRISDAHKLIGSPWLIGRKRRPFSEEWKRRISLGKVGFMVSEETKRKMSETHKKIGTGKWMIGRNIGIKHFLWKGDKVGYYALHQWVAKWRGKSDICEHCGRSGLSGHQIHWANKSGNYLRDLSDWIRLCVSCHKKYDSRKVYG